MKYNRIKNQNFYVGYNKGHEILKSYNTIVAINNGVEWITSKGLHDWSCTTGKQITQYTEIDTNTRRKTWKIIDIQEFKKLTEEVTR